MTHRFLSSRLNFENALGHGIVLVRDVTDMHNTGPPAGTSSGIKWNLLQLHC